MNVDDIYGGLDDINLGEQITELKQRNASLSAQLKKREGDVYKLMKEITDMLQREDNLKKNISELYKTASTELVRKNQLIDQLRGQLDDMVFRRGPRHQSGKKRPGTTEDNEPPSKRSCVENESVSIVGHSETNILSTASSASNGSNSSNSADISKQDDPSARLLKRGEGVKGRRDQSSNPHAERSKLDTRSKSNVRSKSKVGRRSRSPPRRSQSRSPRRKSSRSPHRRRRSRSPPKGRKRSRSPRRRTRDRRLSRYSSERHPRSPNRSQTNRDRRRTPDRRNFKDTDDVIIVKDDRDVIFVKHDRGTPPKIVQTSTTKTPIRRRRITAVRIADCTPDRELVKQKTDVVTVEQGCSKMEASTSNRTEVGEKLALTVNREAGNTSFFSVAEAARNEFYESYTKAEPEKNSNLFETVQSVEPESNRPEFTKFLDNLIKTNNQEQHKPTKPGFRWPSNLIEIDRTKMQAISSTPGEPEHYSSGIGCSNKTSEYSECLSGAEIEYSSSGLVTKVNQLVKKTVVVPVVPKFCESPAGSNESDGDFSGRLMIDEQPQDDFLEKAKTVDTLTERFERDANKPSEKEVDRMSGKSVEVLQESPGHLQPGRRGRRICKRIRISDNDIVGSKEEEVRTKENQQPRIGTDSFEEGRKIEEASQIENIPLENVGKEHKSGEEQFQNKSKVANVLSPSLKELEESTILRELLESNQTGNKIENKTAENKKKEVKHGQSQKQPNSKKTKGRVKNIIKIKVSKNVKVEQIISKKANVKEEQKKQSKATRKNSRNRLEDNNYEKPENNETSNCKISFQPEEVSNATSEEKAEDRKPSEDLENSSKSSTISTRKLEDNNSSEIHLTRCEDTNEEENQCSKQPSDVEKYTKSPEGTEAESKLSNQLEEVLINPISEEVKNEKVSAVSETSEEIKRVETEEKSQQQVQGSRKRSPRLKEVSEEKRNLNEVSKLSDRKECSSKVTETKSQTDQQSTTVKPLEIPKTNEKLDSEATETDNTKVVVVQNQAENELEQAKPTTEEPLRHFPKKFEVCSKALSKRSRRLVSIAQEDLAEDAAIDNPTSEPLEAEQADKTYHTVFEQFVRMKSDTAPKSDSEAEETNKSSLGKVGSEPQEEKGRQKRESISEMSVFEIEEDIVKARRDYLLSIIEMDEDESQGTTLEEKGTKSIGIKEESLGVKEGSLGIIKEILRVEKEALGIVESGVEHDFGTKQEDLLRVEKEVLGLNKDVRSKEGGLGVQKKLLGVIKDLRSKKKDLNVENDVFGVKKEASVVENSSVTKEGELGVEKEVLGCKKVLVVETEGLGVINVLKNEKEDLCVQKKLLGVIQNLRSKKKSLSVKNNVLGAKKKSSRVENDIGIKKEALRVEKDVIGIKKELAVRAEVVGVKKELISKKEGLSVKKEVVEGKPEAVGVTNDTVGVLKEAAVTSANASSSKIEKVSGPAAAIESKTDATAKTAHHNASPKKRITPIKIDNISQTKFPNENFEECHRVKSKTDVTLASRKDVFGTNRLGPCMPDLFGSPSRPEDPQGTKRDTSSTDCFVLIKKLSGELKDGLNLSKVSSPRQSLTLTNTNNSSVLTKTGDRGSGLGGHKDVLKTSEWDTSDIEDRLKAMDSLESNSTLLDSPAMASTADLQNLLSETPKDRIIVPRVSCSSGRRRRCIVKISD